MKMLAVSLFFLLFPSSYSYAYDRTKYDAWERGTIDVIDRWAADATEKYKKMWSRWQIVAGHRKQGANHDHIDEYKTARCNFIVSVSKLKVGGDYKLGVPASLDKINASAKRVIESHNMLHRHVSETGKTNCESLSREQMYEVLYSFSEFLASRSKFDTLAQSRKKHKVDWVNTLSIQLRPLPLEIEIINGALKLKVSKRIGKGVVDFHSGLSRSEKAYHGLHHLVILTPDMQKRILDIRGLNLSFDLPALKMDIFGPTMVLTCSEMCAKQFEAI